MHAPRKGHVRPGYSKRVAIYKPGRETSPCFQPPEPWENNYLMFKLPSLWYIGMLTIKWLSPFCGLRSRQSHWYLNLNMFDYKSPLWTTLWILSQQIMNRDSLLKQYQALHLLLFLCILIFTRFIRYHKVSWFCSFLFIIIWFLSSSRMLLFGLSEFQVNI